MFILFAQNEPKRAAVHLSAGGGCPALLETTGSLETRSAQTCQTPISVVSLVLGCVKWHLKTFCLEIPKTLLGVVVKFLLYEKSISVNIKSSHQPQQAMFQAVIKFPRCGIIYRLMLFWW